MFEQMPEQQSSNKKPLSPEELFGSNVFEVNKEGQLKKVSEDIEKPPIKKEIPESIKEEAEQYAKAKAYFARNPKEAAAIMNAAIEEFYKIKAEEIKKIKRINELKEKQEGKKVAKEKEKIIELTEEVK